MKKIVLIVIFVLSYMAGWITRPTVCDQLGFSPKAGIYSVDEATGLNGETLKTDLIRINFNTFLGEEPKKYRNVPHALGNYLVVGENGVWYWTDSLSEARDLYSSSEIR